MSKINGRARSFWVDTVSVWPPGPGVGPRSAQPGRLAPDPPVFLPVRQAAD